MIHNTPRTVFDYIFALTMVVALIAFYFTDTTICLSVFGFVCAIKFLVRPVWLLFNYKRLKREGQIYSATVVDSQLISLFLKGQPHRVIIQFTDRNGKERHITMHHTTLPPSAGDNVKVLFCENEPENFLVIPRCYHTVLFDLLAALMMIVCCIFLLFCYLN